MNLKDEKVIHRSFGPGRVVRSSDSYIEIEFPSGKKKFVFPDVFATYLKLEDKDISRLVDEILEEKQKEQKEEKQQLKEEREIQLRKRQIKRQQDKISKSTKAHPSMQAVFWCDADEIDEVFDEWRVTTGLIKSGAKEGKPNRLARLSRQSACLITTREPDVAEKDRRIEGLYMVNETFIGKLSEDGYVPAHSEYRLRLSEEEIEKMLFWNYYVNNRYPDKMTWNTGRYRYFENIMMAQILKDIISLKEDSKDQEFVKGFFNYFCELNLIDVENLPEPNGALKRI